MTGTRHRRGRTLLALAVLLVTAWVVLPTSLGGQNAYVVTHGNSMEPRFHTGDLAVVRVATSYAVGDVVAYRSQSLQTTVMHRIVAVHDGRYVFKGDHNTFLDPEHPQRGQLIGTLALRIPQGGTWLSRLTHPALLAIAALVLLATGTQAARHRDRRGRRSASMNMTRTRRPPGISAATSSQVGRAGLTACAALAALGILLALVAWKAPHITEPGRTAVPAATTTFAYHAAVVHSAAYDSDIVTSPDPIFRRLSDQVDVEVHYSGPPGSMSVAADVAAPSGWHTNLALLPPTAFEGTSHDATVELDLHRIDARAKAAAQAIGIPYDQLTLALTATISTRDGQRLAPTLNLVLTPSHLKLAGGRNTLTVHAPQGQPATADRRAVRVLGQALNTDTTLMLAMALGGAAALVGLLTIVLAGRGPRDEAQAIQARYGSLLLPIRPPAALDQHETVEVQDFPALARIAERYGLVIMTWPAQGGQVFVLQDQYIRYRYTTARPEGRRSRSDRRHHNGLLPDPPTAVSADHHNGSVDRS